MESKIIHENEKYEIQPFRNHPTYILEQMWGVLIVLFVLLAQNAEVLSIVIELIKHGKVLEVLSVIGGGLLVVILVLAWYVNRWYRTTIEIKDFTITVQRKTLNRLVNSIAVQNISNINIERNLFEMVMGTCKLKLDTNSLSTANSTDVKIVLKRKKAEELKDILTRMMQELSGENVQRTESNFEDSDRMNGMAQSSSLEAMQGASMGQADTGESLSGERIIRYTHAEIIRNCIMNTSVAVFLGTIASVVSAVIAIASDSNVFKTGSVIGIILAVIFIGYTFFTQIIKTWLADFNFAAKREGDKIYVKFGLLTEDHYTVPVDKINAIVLESKMLGRIFGYASLRVINVGGEKDDVDGMKLLLADKEAELLRKMQILLPEFDFSVMEQMENQPKRVLIKKMVAVFFLALCVFVGIFTGLSLSIGQGASSLMIWVLIAALAVFILIGLGKFLSYRITKLAQTDQYIMFSRGVFGRTIVSIPYEKIQYVTVQQGPVERMLHIEHATMYILANSLRQAQTTGYFSQGEFDRLIENVRATYIKI